MVAVLRKGALIILILSLVCRDGKTQDLTTSNVCSFSTDSIVKELIIEGKYSIQQCENLGKALSTFDLERGKRRIFTYSGPFNSGCEICFYYKYGFVTQDFSLDDVRWETVDAFVNAYNQEMRKRLPPETSSECHDRIEPGKVFSGFLTTLIKIDIDHLNDSLINIKLTADTLEYLFKNDINLLQISFSWNLSDEGDLRYSYAELKNTGVVLSLITSERPMLFITLDFAAIPARYDICWCPALEQKYRLMLTVK